MKGILNIPYLIDEAHGWIIVTREDLRKARLHPDDFPKAYRTKGEELFALEEDCEMPLLLDKLNSNGVLYQINEKFITYDDKDNPRNWR
jgi:ribosome assembly protein YihI (activator of Der GTPase)|tara:strand:+ start:396 stop:662 length:267 start_codon:yes stop_codon:yes gene_type:complete